MLCQRRDGSLCRQRRIARSASGGRPGAMRAGGSGSASRMAESVSSCEPRRKGCRPVSISYSSTPKEKTSVRASTGFPAACSGDM
jgi:hypothetical protein